MYSLYSSLEESESDADEQNGSSIIPGLDISDDERESCSWSSLDVEQHAFKASRPDFLGSTGRRAGEIAIVSCLPRCVLEITVVEDENNNQPSEASASGSGAILSSGLSIDSFAKNSGRGKGLLIVDEECVKARL